MTLHRLTLDDQRVAVHAAWWRYQYALQHGQRARFEGATLVDLTVGMLGERAASRVLELPWEPLRVLDYAGDLGNGWQVRTRRPNGMRPDRLALMLRPADDNDQTMVHVVALDLFAGVFDVVGMVPIGHGKRIGTYRSDMPDPCTLVERNQLFLIEDVTA